MKANINIALRVAATIGFGCAAFGISIGHLALVPIGLSLWCLSTLV